MKKPEWLNLAEVAILPFVGVYILGLIYNMLWLSITGVTLVAMVVIANHYTRPKQVRQLDGYTLARVRYEMKAIVDKQSSDGGAIARSYGLLNERLKDMEEKEKTDG